MTEHLTNVMVSVVVVSRDRPTALLRCLTGLNQLQYLNFEVVVVADPKGEAAVARSPFADLVKLVGFDRANISEARNLGISHAAGDVVAFIDDDAVPEPTWLTQLVAPARRPNVAAMGGYVRGRNGISFQWRAQRRSARRYCRSGHEPETGHDPDAQRDDRHQDRRHEYGCVP
ncbi:glycosyltransferase family 2 protein [Tateyamaria sp.]|uniref:glycosyltransferase family 2 protein n=1 Tax=Tateyamaria sp. TaxID=1929288 RepID=UPI003B221443